MFFHDVKDCYYIATGSCGYHYPSKFWRHSLIGMPHSETAWLWALWGEHCLLRGKHKKLKYVSKKHTALLYYYAYSLYLQGLFCEASAIICHFLKLAPEHKEAIYLYSDCLYSMEKRGEAVLALCVPQVLKRRKTWIKLANLVEDHADFFRLQKLYAECVSHSLVSSDDVVVLENMAMGAQRAGEYKTAEQIWHHIVGIQKKGTLQTKVQLNQLFAQEALAAFVSATKKVGLEVFLISGTLLGFVRSGNFLPHDTDLDIGIFDGFEPDHLKKGIYAAGCFSIMPQRSPHCLRVRHVNGTPIDIFTHYRDKNDFWHGGVKVSWHNSPFTLKDIQFKGIPVLIPDNPETYLEENYGKDWKLPKEKFDSAVDCPNLKIENEYELRIHHMKNGRILSAMEDKDD